MRTRDLGISFVVLDLYTYGVDVEFMQVDGTSGISCPHSVPSYFRSIPR